MNLRELDDLKKWAVKQSTANWLAKTVVSSISGILAFIPAYILWFFLWLTGPVGFWQTFAVVAGWIIVFGAAQVGFLVCGIIIIVAIISAAP